MEEEDCGKETGGVLKAPSLLSLKEKVFTENEFCLHPNKQLRYFFFFKCDFFSAVF